MAVENGDIGLLKSLGIKDSELGDVKFFLEKLVNTGFLDWIWILFDDLQFKMAKGSRKISARNLNEKLTIKPN